MNKSNQCVEGLRELEENLTNFELCNQIAKNLKIPMTYHIGTPGCRKCGGTGFMKMPIFRKLLAHYFERIPWNVIRKNVFCNKCDGEWVTVDYGKE